VSRSRQHDDIVDEALTAHRVYAIEHVCAHLHLNLARQPITWPISPTGAVTGSYRHFEVIIAISFDAFGVSFS
jgi:hypothetical protein